MILLWGLLEDPPLHALREILERKGARYAFLDQRSAPPEYQFRFGRSLEGRVGDLDLSTVSAAYIRPFDYGLLPEHAVADDRAQRVGALRKFAHHLTNWLELTPALVVNRISAQASNTSKLFQLQLIRASGFAVPESLVTTDAAEVRAFLGCHGSVIYKSLSSVRSIVARLEASGLERLESLQHCPTLFQRCVPGTDYRVHVVGRRVFTTVLWSESDDYRYDELAERVAVELPRAVTDRCIRLTRRLGLDFSGVDLRRTPGGEWFCFEVNPSPGFPYYDPDGSAGIGTALATLLLAAPPCVERGAAEERRVRASRCFETVRPARVRGDPGVAALGRRERASLESTREECHDRFAPVSAIEARHESVEPRRRS